MSEAREKARALLAAMAGVGLTAQKGGGPMTHGIVVDAQGASLFMEADDRIPIGSLHAIAAAPGLLAALCDESDSLRAELAKVTAVAARESSEANAILGEVDCMEHEDAQLRAELDRLRAELAQESALRAELAAEVKRLKAQLSGAMVCNTCGEVGREMIEYRDGDRPMLRHPGCGGLVSMGGFGAVIVEGGE